MRILLATVAEKPHFLGMVPLGWALRAAGHEVRVASQPDLMPTASDTGLPSVPVGRDHNFWRIMRAYSVSGQGEDKVPFVRGAALPPGEITWDYVRNGHRQAFLWWWKIINDPMADDLVDLCRQWRPDLVIWEPLSFAAPIAAEAVGAVHARLLWGADIFALMRGHLRRLIGEQPPAEQEDLLRDWLEQRARAAGTRFTERMTSGYFTIDYLPSALRLPEPAQVRYEPMRYIPYNGRSTLPAWLRTPPERTRVCLTLGTSATERQGGYSLPVADILDGLADLDAEIIATLPRTERERLGPLPPNVRPVEFAPLHALAETCSAVINHGGWGTFLCTTSLGVPQVVVPTWFDNVLPARALEAEGGGVHVPPERADGETVPRAVRAILRDPAYTSAAYRLRAQMESAPTPNRIATDIEAITQRHADTAHRN